MGGFFGPIIFGYGALILVPLVIIVMIYAGVFEGARKVRRRHTPDCAAEHPESLYRGGRNPHPILDDSCKLPLGHAGPHRDRDSSGTTHKWENNYCSYMTCCQCQAQHVVGDKTFQCSDVPNHSGLHTASDPIASRTIPAGVQRVHMWSNEQLCKHPHCKVA